MSAETKTRVTILVVGLCAAIAFWLGVQYVNYRPHPPTDGVRVGDPFGAAKG